MAVVLSNQCVAEGIYHMCIQLPEGLFHPDHALTMIEPIPGQFYMVRAWEREPLLSRPISVHDYDSKNHVLSLLYQVVGRGTDIMRQLSPTDSIWLEGPFGNGFPLESFTGGLSAVGGGIGIAPLYFACKAYKKYFPDQKLKVYLGFSKEAYLISQFEAVADEVIVDIGGIITDQIKDIGHEAWIACGPQIMMDALCKKIPSEQAVYLSYEARMACGFGACLGCGIETKAGRKRVCKDGPVFSREVLK